MPYKITHLMLYLSLSDLILTPQTYCSNVLHEITESL